MDDDGRSGRWMARGNMGKLTPLEAFMSDDAKRGRVWADGEYEYKRTGDSLVHRGGSEPDWPWVACVTQVAAMEGTVTWADEPKAPTPQEALQALVDGKVVIAIGCGRKYKLRLCEDGCLVGAGEARGNYFIIDLNDAKIAPDPSQPAEPQVEYPLSYEEAMQARKNGYEIASCIGPGKAKARWRIVDGGK